ncbi:MAG: leucyl-tRNA synthetase, leucyl-tRNA synthetase, partial [Candidatus Parcubacteria bacterium]
MKQYDHSKIEKKWQKEWDKKKLYRVPDTASRKDNHFQLVEFPYPSGNLHVGHWYAFSVPDILARMLRMKGKNVLYPIGFDAFGLPAENAAIKNKLNPRKWTEANMKKMREQIRSMGTSFDWSREVVTCHPEYYRWTQWQFLQFFKNDLAYRKDTPVNWCPKDKTVLANEQVVSGKCERCDTEVEQRNMLQWNLRITKYADRLVDDLNALDWPEQIKESQRNWIGRSEGAEVDFPLVDDVKRVVLLHGKGGSATGGPKVWLKEKLEKLGYEVLVPQLPNTDEPNDEEQADYVQKHCVLDEKTAIVGHSFGGIVALRLLERGVKVKRVALVATPFSGKYLDKKMRPSVSAALKKGFDFKKIKQQATFVVLSDISDTVVPISDGEAYAEALGAYVMKSTAQESHYNGAYEPDVFAVSVPTLRVFTTRPDTLFGATYMVLAPEHPFVTAALKGEGPLRGLTNGTSLSEYVEAARRKSELDRLADQKEKTGVRLEGVYAVNPANQEKIALFVADYVLGHYGTGAIMAVPAHDERDGEFAKKFNLPIREVVEPRFIKTEGYDAVRADVPTNSRNAVMAIVQHWNEDKYLCLSWNNRPLKGFVCGGIEDGEDAVAAGIREIQEETGYTSAQHVRSLGGLSTHFYHVVKNVNRDAHFSVELYKLASGDSGELSKKESDLHTASWVLASDVEAFIDRKDFGHAWSLHRQPKPFTDSGVLVNSGEFTGMDSEEAKRQLTRRFGVAKKTYKLRDWIVSRQRYWGVPIPVIHC